MVAITEGSTKEIIALNAVAGAEPWPIPVVLVSPYDEPALMSAVRSGAKASLLVDGVDDRDARAKNVIARVDRGKELIVVSTPQSGWFRCAGETRSRHRAVSGTRAMGKLGGLRVQASCSSRLRVTN